MKVRIEVSLEHPVMFISDPYCDESAPLEIQHHAQISTDRCVAFQIRPYFDGGADVTISSDAPSVETASEFSGSVLCKSDILSLSDSHKFNYCLFPIRGGRADVEIWRAFDGGENVWIKIAPLVEY